MKPRDRASAIVLTERDRLLVAELARMRLLTRAQIVALGFFGSTARANARLCQLRQAGFVARLATPIGEHQSRAIYRVGCATIPLLAERLPGGLEAATALAKTPSPLLVSHTLAVAEIRIALNRDGALRCWRGETECFHRFSIRKLPTDPWQSVSLRPDGYADLAVDDVIRSVFVEADLGHVSLPRIADKFALYDAYRACGLFERTYGRDRFDVFMVTTGAKRLANLQALATKHPGLVIRFAQFSDLRHEDAGWSFGNDVRQAPGGRT